MHDPGGRAPPGGRGPRGRRHAAGRRRSRRSRRRARPDLAEQAGTVNEWDDELERLLAEVARGRAGDRRGAPAGEPVGDQRWRGCATDPDSSPRDLARPMPRRPRPPAAVRHPVPRLGGGAGSASRSCSTPTTCRAAPTAGSTTRPTCRRWSPRSRPGRSPTGHRRRWSRRSPSCSPARWCGAGSTRCTPTTSAGPDHWLVVDWKTNRHRSADPLQLALYRVAWAELAGVPVERVRAAFRYVRTGDLVEPAELPGRGGPRRRSCTDARVAAAPSGGPPCGARTPSAPSTHLAPLELPDGTATGRAASGERGSPDALAAAAMHVGGAQGGPARRRAASWSSGTTRTLALAQRGRGSRAVRPGAPRPRRRTRPRRAEVEVTAFRQRPACSTPRSSRSSTRSTPRPEAPTTARAPSGCSPTPLRDFRRAGVDRDQATRSRLRELNEQRERARLRPSPATSATAGGHPGAGAGDRGDARRTTVDDHPPDADGTVAITTRLPRQPPVPDATRATPRPAARSRRASPTSPGRTTTRCCASCCALRREQATLLGYADWPTFDAEVKMIGTGDAVMPSSSTGSPRRPARPAAATSSVLRDRAAPRRRGHRRPVELALLVRGGARATSTASTPRRCAATSTSAKVRHGLLDVTCRLFGLQLRAAWRRHLARGRVDLRRDPGGERGRPDPPRPAPAGPQVQPRRAVRPRPRHRRPAARRGRAGLQLPVAA